ncbi:MAG: hypothetical protein KIT09_27760 [Bryobacteraceae bacterium]|nr:hypothetical protein [Bryobacteraceae bacterium]
MANLLRGLTVGLTALLSAPAWSQYDKPFSHATHLKLEARCVACHAEAGASAKAEDNLLPKAEACERCHEPGRIGAPPATLVTNFSHEFHLRLGNVAPVILAAVRTGKYLSAPAEGLERQLAAANACAACHRGLETSEGKRTHLPAMADCLVCHAKIEPPFSCETCHAPGPHLKPASHTPQYLEEHSRPGALEERQSCAVCHGRKFTCLGCH